MRLPSSHFSRAVILILSTAFFGLVASVFIELAISQLGDVEAQKKLIPIGVYFLSPLTFPIVSTAFFRVGATADAASYSVGAWLFNVWLTRSLLPDKWGIATVISIVIVCVIGSRRKHQQDYSLGH
jgi:hypothetical protein